MPNAFDTPFSLQTRGLLALSALIAVCGIVGGFLTGIWMVGFLLWNLFLAWVPYALGRWIVRLAVRSEHGTGLLVVPTLVWLLFLPNAPYIVTDLIHLKGLPTDLLVPGALLISAIAALALALGLLSLRDMHQVVRSRLGANWGWAFAGTVCGLCGIGVWMGRVLRWNSWDAFTRPHEVLVSSLAGLFGNGQALLFAGGFGLLLFLLYRWTAGLTERAPRR